MAASAAGDEEDEDDAVVSRRKARSVRPPTRFRDMLKATQPVSGLVSDSDSNDNDNDGDEDDGDDDDDDDGNGVQAMGGGGDDVRSLALEMELMRVVSKLLDDDSSGEDGSTSEVCPILSALILSSMRIT